MPSSSHHHVILPLNTSHKFDEFDCGDPARNNWLKARALASHESDDSRCYAAVDQAGRISGFYAIATSAILRAALPGAMRRNAPDPISCVLLAQLAVDLSCQGQALGRELVLHAMGRAVKIAEIAGCRLLILHPSPLERAGYYRKFGFVDFATAPAVMGMRLKEVRALLDAVAIGP